MKNTLLSLFALVFALSSFGQKVDLDPFKFSFESRDLPHVNASPDFKTFSTLVNVSRNCPLSKEAIESRINLQGFERKDNGCDIKLIITFDDLIISNNKVVEMVSETKNKDGSSRKIYSYKMAVEYYMNGTVDYMGKSGEELCKGTPISAGGNSWESNTYNTSYEAEKFWNDNRYSMISKFTSDKLNAGIAQINSTANSHFGYPVNRRNLEFWLIDNKKHPEHDIMQAKFEELKPMMAEVSANAMSEATRTKMLEFIKYFDDLKAAYDKDEKGHRKVRYAAFFNNSLLYYLLDMPEKAITEAEGLIANDYDPKDGKTLKLTAEKLKDLFSKANIYKTHFQLNARPYGVK